jgi:hypothetical protein
MPQHPYIFLDEGADSGVIGIEHWALCAGAVPRSSTSR